jgi:hypothetical protein
MIQPDSRAVIRLHGESYVTISESISIVEIQNGPMLPAVSVSLTIIDVGYA